MSKTNKTTNPKYREGASLDKLRITYARKRRLDINLLPRHLLIQILENIGPAYLNGLKQIEFRQSADNISAIGQYYPKEKKILLYYVSYPIDLTSTTTLFRESLVQHGAILFMIGEKEYCKFSSLEELRLWYIDFVLCHEIAHHHVLYLNKYRKPRIDIKTDEKRTNVVAKRIYEQLIRDLAEYS